LVNSEKERRRRSLLLLLLLLFPRESERSSQAFKKTTPYVFLWVGFPADEISGLDVLVE
jgi:hypothetical protein